MNIQSISKENANANVTLSASELVLICNMFHEQLAKEKSNPKFLELYGDLMLAKMCIRDSILCMLLQKDQVQYTIIRCFVM